MFNLNRGQRPEPDAIEVIIGPRATFSGALRCDTSIRIDGAVEAGHVETPANVVLTDGAALVHRVERRDCRNLCRCKPDDLGTQLDALR